MEENEEKFRELEEKIEALEELIEGGLESPEEEGFLDIQTSGVEDFRLFWINIDDIDVYEKCEDIDSAAKAQIAFKEYALVDGTAKSGDVFVLLCNRAEEPEEGYSEDEEDTPPVCYYIGMCVVGGTPVQEPSLSDIPAKADQFEFIAWDTCGGVCPEPKGVRIKQLKAPESGSSSGESCLSHIYDPMSQGSEGASNMILSRLKSLSEGEVSGADGASRSFFAFKSYKKATGEDGAIGERETADLTEERNGETIGLRPFIEFVNIQTTPKSIEAEIEEVSLKSTPLQFYSKEFQKKNLELAEVSLYSDKCGTLGVEKELSDGESETFDVLSNAYPSGQAYEIQQHAFNKVEYDGDEEQEPVTVAGLSEVSIFTHSDDMGADVYVDELRDPWIPMIPAKGGGTTLFSGDYFPAESKEGGEFITVTDLTYSGYSSSIISESGGIGTRKVILTFFKEKQHNQFYSGLWCGGIMPPSGEHPVPIDVDFNIPVGETYGFTGEKDLFVQGRDEYGDLLDPSIKVSLGYIDTEKHERPLTVSRDELIEPATVSLGLVKEFGYEDGVDLFKTGISTVKIPASEFTNDENLANTLYSFEPVSIYVTTPVVEGESGSGSEQSVQDNLRTITVEFDVFAVDTKHGLITNKVQIPDRHKVFTDFELPEVPDVSLGTFDDTIFKFEPANVSIYTPNSSGESSGSSEETPQNNLRTLEIKFDAFAIDTDKGLILDESQLQDPLIIKTDFELPGVPEVSLGTFNDTINKFEPVHVSIYKPASAEETGAVEAEESNTRTIEIAFDSFAIDTEKGLIIDETELSDRVVLRTNFDLPAGTASGLDQDPLVIFDPERLETTIITNEPESLADENQSTTRQLNIKAFFKGYNHTIEDGLIKSREEIESPELLMIEDTVDLPAGMTGGTGFDESIFYEVPLAVSLYNVAPESGADENVNKIEVALKTQLRTITTDDGLITSDVIGAGSPGYYTSSIELPIPTVSLGATQGYTGDLFSTKSHGITLLNSVSNDDGSYDLNYQYAYEETVYDVKNGIVKDPEDGASPRGNDFTVNIPAQFVSLGNVSLGVTQGITDTINSPTLGGVTVTKTDNSETGGETITIQANHANNFYEVENGLIKEASTPATNTSNTDVSFDIPPAVPQVSIGNGFDKVFKTFNPEVDPAVTYTGSDSANTEVQIKLSVNKVTVENGFVKSVEDESEGDDITINLTIPKSAISGYVEKTMLVCDEDGNSRVITVLAKE